MKAVQLFAQIALFVFVASTSHAATVFICGTPDYRATYAAVDTNRSSAAATAARLCRTKSPTPGLCGSVQCVSRTSVKGVRFTRIMAFKHPLRIPSEGSAVASRGESSRSESSSSSSSSSSPSAPAEQEHRPSPSRYRSQGGYTAGGITHYDDGSSSYEAGGITHYSDGSSSYTAGGITHNSDGSSSYEAGGITHYSDGTSSYEAGGITHFSNGKSCYTAGGIRHCS